jgi:hypothetical protein
VPCQLKERVNDKLNILCKVKEKQNLSHLVLSSQPNKLILPVYIYQCYYHCHDNHNNSFQYQRPMGPVKATVDHTFNDFSK